MATSRRVETVYVKAPSFRRAAESVRETLDSAGLKIFADSDLGGSAKILYVACPFLLLEALAFDRSSAVFLPVQVTVLATQGGATVQWLDAAALPIITLPLGARKPFE